MPCEIPKEVLGYLESVEQDCPRACREQHALAAYVRRVFDREDVHVDREQLGHYLGLVKYFPYDRLFPWEEFLLTLWDCTYKADGTPRWKTVLCMVGRGAGKDGFIAFDSACSISPYNPVAHFGVSKTSARSLTGVTACSSLLAQMSTL